MFQPALPQRPVRRDNPFTGPAALAGRRFAAPGEGGAAIHPWAPDLEPDARTRAVDQALRDVVLDPAYSCVGARSAVRQDAYRFGVYGAIADADATPGLAHDLWEFAAEQPTIPSDFSTFVAVFDGADVADEREFEALLWRQLQMLHDLDAPHHDWDRTVSTDPEDPHFQWSFAGVAFFVVGMHPRSSRLARRFPWPALVFNTHLQFERLRAWDQYDRFRDVVRARDTALQGSINPVLTDFGDRSAARQYSGRHVEAEWRCPFSARFVDHDAPPTPAARRERGRETPEPVLPRELDGAAPR